MINVHDILADPTLLTSCYNSLREPEVGTQDGVTQGNLQLHSCIGIASQTYCWVIAQWRTLYKLITMQLTCFTSTMSD